MARILIAGCGYVGTSAADLFHGAGWEVEGWTHSPESATRLRSKPYAVRAVDITKREAVQRTGAKFEVAIHCASTRGGDPDAYRLTYAVGVSHLLELLRPDRFVFVSSTSVYAQSTGEWVDEESPAEPQHPSGRILRQTEDFVREKGGIVARVAGIYGPGRSALLRKFLSGAARLENGGERWQNQAHRDDIAGALFLLASLPENPGIVNIADTEPRSQRQCYAWLAAQFQRPLPPSAEQTRPRKRGSSNKRVSSKKLRALGWEPRFPSFEIGMENSVLPALDAEGA